MQLPPAVTRCAVRSHEPRDRPEAGVIDVADVPRLQPVPKRGVLQGVELEPDLRSMRRGLHAATPCASRAIYKHWVSLVCSGAQTAEHLVACNRNKGSRRGQLLSYLEPAGVSVLG